MKLQAGLFALLLVSCMDTRSANLGRQVATDPSDEGEDGQDPSSDPYGDAAMAEAGDAAPEPTDSASQQPAPDASVGESEDASAVDGAVTDGAAPAEPRPARRDGGARDGGATNPICRIEPWHCQ